MSWWILRKILRRWVGLNVWYILFNIISIVFVLNWHRILNVEKFVCMFSLYLKDKVIFKLKQFTQKNLQTFTLSGVIRKVKCWILSDKLFIYYYFVHNDKTVYQCCSDIGNFVMFFTCFKALPLISSIGTNTNIGRLRLKHRHKNLS